MPERRYALTKVDAGDYLLHGNDVEPTLPGDRGVGTMFRLSRWEDGPHLGAERVRTVWTLSRAPWAKARDAIETSVYGNPLNDVEWEHVGEFPTRSAAVEEAVALSDRTKVSP